MKKLILFTITTLLLLFNCSNSNNGLNEPPIPCNDGICLTDKQLNFFKEYLEDDTLTKKVLFEMSSMDLSSKDITSLDTGIFDNLTNLTRVDLTDNDICSVDKSDVGLTDRVNLTFDVGGCLTADQLTFFRMHITDITKKQLFEATTLDLSNKSITSLDTGIFNNLTNLNSVDLTDNTICIVDKADVGLADGVNLNFEIGQCLTDAQLTFFNDHISSITTKQELYEAPSLDLQSKSITSLEAGIFNNLTNLTGLNLGFNDLTNIPAEIGNLTSLTTLQLFDNQLASIPTEIFNLTSLTVLNFRNNALTDIPAEIGNLTSLTSLRLHENGLDSIPTEIGNLANLTQLNLYNNELANIPAEIGNLTKLTDLRLYNNLLTSIPAEIGNLRNLTTLTLHSNKLASIPTEIGNLTNLTTLRLDNNNLTSIPAEIGNLTSLINLLLSSNQLASIPAGIFTNLTSLTSLTLKLGSRNTFDCTRDNYDTWGLPDPVGITNFRCS